MDDDPIAHNGNERNCVTWCSIVIQWRQLRDTSERNRGREQKRAKKVIVTMTMTMMMLLLLLLSSNEHASAKKVGGKKARVTFTDTAYLFTYVCCHCYEGVLRDT